MWFVRGKKKVARRQSRRAPARDAHYAEYKEHAREIITARVAYWNQTYQFSYGRIAIKNQRRCWGSCSEKQNLNFNYKIIFLPEALMDYVVVHELCHLAELNHSKHFWAEVAKSFPEYKEHARHLERITHVPARGFPSSVVATQEILA
ncbi:M48 family metallopeptidase [Candidatus Parcubacteria bacterium]|uniref:YgjP-like metallopeptidase domain-containing protein n=1 Tax=Candidatus Kaiserbacteria bacterium CG10_big_fil_rev_8_21_14_0_10_47_16 TaxID=1974608 RepID=A0A2H0UEW5_9BACT|nr:M48 family metallopeptidase [Candidatus Parcubacteria bacterium]PIR84315.1 MAG: hypothetical protein COU16_01830 [Candidatus Kaiserbacteria bacterium CG10_big_fil_rev_8_21_14_0_10_47_16]